MKYLRELVITILVALVLVLWIRGRSAEVAAARILELEKEKAQLQHERDSVEELKNVATLEALRALTEKGKSDANAQRLHHRNQILTAQHERLLKAGRVALSDSAILREWSELYADR